MDPSRHLGTCYGASSFLRLGETQGFGRRSGRYVAHGQVKDVCARALHRRARELLAGTFDHPLLADPRSPAGVARIDCNTADLTSLIRRLETITDPRDRRGIRHGFATTLVLIACATLAGNKSLVAISEWCESSSQQVLSRLGARISLTSGLRIPPSYATIRRATMAVDADALDRIVNTWAGAQAAHGARVVGDGATGEADTTDPRSLGPGPDDAGNAPGADLVGVAIDGKAVRGARRGDGTQVQLLAALRHDTGMVIGQANVENDKTNEIVTFPGLIDQLDLTGRVVTADALHTQKNAATLVAGKGGHFVLGVKQNQLRHAFGSNVADAGGALDVIAELLGHRSVASSQVYLHPDPARLRRAVDAVGTPRASGSVER